MTGIIFLPRRNFASQLIPATSGCYYYVKVIIAASRARLFEMRIAELITKALPKATHITGTTRVFEVIFKQRLSISDNIKDALLDCMLENGKFHGSLEGILQFINFSEESKYGQRFDRLISVVNHPEYMEAKLFTALVSFALERWLVPWTISRYVVNHQCKFSLAKWIEAGQPIDKQGLLTII